MATRISELSLIYVKVQVTATKAGATYNPTSDTVQIAFIGDSLEPASGDWKSALWETIGSLYYAKILVGPGGTVTLAPGTYDPWVKITDNPEIPVMKSPGTLIVYAN